MSNDVHAAVLIAVMAAVTMGLRFIPFLVMGDRKIPKLLVYLGDFLPPAIMGTLIVFCLRNTPVMTAPHGIPELIAGAFVVITYAIKKSTLFSVLGGAALYMVLVQLVF